VREGGRQERKKERKGERETWPEKKQHGKKKATSNVKDII